MEERFHTSALDGDVFEVKEILKSNPGIDVNWRAEGHRSALFSSCINDHPSVVAILLAHPDIDVNQIDDDDGWTPFLAACDIGSTRCVRLLLKDSRVQVNGRTTLGNTALRWAACNHHLDIIKWWIASGREMDLGQPGNKWTDAIGAARESYWGADVVAVLERFKENPEETRDQMRLEVGWDKETAAEVFALVVFVSDGLLRVYLGNQSTPTRAARFFTIAKRLPLELQMVLSYRVAGSAKEIISRFERETAFKNLASVVETL